MHRRQGNPRPFGKPNGANWRHPQGNRSGVYGSQSRLADPTQYVDGDDNGIPTKIRINVMPTNVSGFRRNRAASVDHTVQGRQNFHTPAGHPGNNFHSPAGHSRNNFHSPAGHSRSNFHSPAGHYSQHGQRRFSHNVDVAASNNNPPFDRPTGRRPMGFKVLESLLEKDSEQLLLELSNSKRGISEFIKTNLTDDGIVLFVKILRRVCESSFDETKYKVLQTYLDDTFIDKLIKYTVTLPLQEKFQQRKNQFFWKDPDDYWNNLIKISQDIHDSIPTFGRKVLPGILKCLIVCFPPFEMQHNCHISDAIKESVNKMYELVQALVKEHEEKQKAHLENKLAGKEEDEEPPDDFRQIPLYPSAVELLSTQHGFLRKNVVDGPYKDVNHYLDVQFRLLREDFVGPLRSGISCYRLEQKKRIENVKIYRKVVFLNPETVNEQYCIRLRFDFSKKKASFKYENSRRFMFGSLICFTADNFRSIIFGKVAERNVEDFEKGELIVGFDQNMAARVAYNVNYLMIECSVYFEPYYHVLSVLQTMSTENFPMERYIIHVERNVHPPEYLVGLPGPSYKIKGHEFSPLSLWPNVNFYKLNDSQQLAFRAALTQEFCIIQGPPGTGKTFLGLKIAKTLLENQHAWYRKTPMLVICFTNHALDQFLEGITAFTTNILRVGGQSKNENLKSYNLKNRSRFKVSPAIYQQRDRVQILLGKIKGITENVKQIDFYHSIRAFDVFEDVVPNFRNTWFAQAKRNDILDWLLGENQIEPNKQVNQVQEIFNKLQVNENEDAIDSEESDDEDVFIDENEATQQDDLFEEVSAMNVQCSIPLITVPSMLENITKIQNIVEDLRRNENPTLEDILEEENRGFELFQLKNKYEYLTTKLFEGKEQAMSRKEHPKDTDLRNPHNMTPDDRWKLYFYWLSCYRQKLLEKLELLSKDFRDEFRVYEEMRDIENTNSMKNVLVVGMTTTGAARLRSSLQALKSPVVIVEEAAEVLESHIISSLTKHCRHLILIGDHQQLKPSTASFNVEKFFKLGISLFERMVINKIQLYTLNVQHRMKPEISSLIAPTIYPSLEDHPSVNDRLPITGIDNCLFFIDHKHPEAECEGTSKKNHHEVEFLIYLAKHLILNGYKPQNITILAAYLGQMFEMQKLKKKHKHILEDVRIAVLDNYQGEESDIILLSLVRSNEANKIGFLSIENRVCVALSRARNGFYLMGNMSQLCTASALWRKIRLTFEEQNAIGTKLALRCQVHPDVVTEVEKGEDFLKISEGGCSRKCGTNLVCGHTCTSLCHVLNRDHVGYRCRERCGKKLCDNDVNHICRKMCYQECGPCNYLVQRNLPCGHQQNLECHVDTDTYSCTVLVSTKLPCGHVADKPCHSDPETYRCPHPCEIKVEPCGHACEQMCHIRQDPDHLQYKCRKPCARYRKGCTVETQDHLCRKYCFEECEPCQVLVQKKRTICPHRFNVPCCFNVDEMTCEKPCTKILNCGHKCKSKCHEPCGKCEIKVEKMNPVCGHVVKVKCCDEPDRKLCNKKCPLLLPCGHPCTKQCNEPCTTSCNVKVKCALLSPCGHVVSEVRCSVATSNIAREDPTTLMKYCNNPCRVELKCGHLCSGSCGECYQGRIHKRCAEKCGFPLICNHPCQFPCREACRPCNLPCPYKCKHSSCGKKCGDVCTACKEKCPRRCRHQSCTQFCGDICDVPPCTVPCKNVLICGHKCIGFCGDPCPAKCLVCDKEELTMIFFGSEEDEDARFVLLEDCGHVFESSGLEHWMTLNEEEISFKLCPQCKTPIKTTQRYSDFIKRALADVAKVKVSLHGSSEEIEEKRKTLQLKLLTLELKYVGTLCLNCPDIAQAFEIIKKRLLVNRKGKRQPINKPELNALECKLQIIEHVLKICTDDSVMTSDSAKVRTQMNFIMRLLIKEKDSITNQEIEDIQYELNRLSRMSEFHKIRKSPHFAAHFSSNDEVKRVVGEIEKYLFKTGKFYDEDENNVKVLLQHLSKAVASGIGISDKERREIVRAMGFKQGHWYKCANGHPYAIADCGGAMVEAKCPECHATIGGRNHRLHAGNAVATEMDGATHSAWSEAANMGNYQF